MSADRVLVAGAGPAGLAAAVAIAEAGMPAVVVDPAPDRPWPNNYGAWLHELDPGFHSVVSQTWGRPMVISDSGGEREIDGTYVQVDRAALQTLLTERLSSAGGELQVGAVASARPHSRGTSVTLADGRSLDATVAIDATGFGAPLLDKPRGDPAWQTAYGLLVEVDAHPWEPDQMVLMDFGTAAVGGAASPPSFLYAMPLSDRVVFVEETSLAARPAVPLDVLERRLDRRLDALGLHVRRVLDVERCFIPMDAPLPTMPQPVVGFGGAAGFVHPATGYQLTRSLRTAPRLAQAIVSGLGDGDPARAAELAWRAAWPTSALRSRHLGLLGLQVLADLDASRLGAFMDGFFASPRRHWRAWLSGDAPPAAVAAAMLQIALNLPIGLQWHIVRQVLLSDPRDALPLIAPHRLALPPQSPSR